MPTTQETDFEQALRERGVNADIAAWVAYWMAPEQIAAAIAWYDHPDQRRRGVGPGVLVDELRRGGRPQAQRSVVDDQHAYADRIVAWLAEHLPECFEDGRAHPAAVAAVIRLHYRYGKEGLSVREHGGYIRGCVERWEAESGCEVGAPALAGEEGR